MRFVDTSVLLVAVGGPHPDREVCREFIARDPHGLHVGVEAVQEFAFHRLRRGERATAVRDARRLRLSTIVHDFDQAVLDLALELMDSTSLRGRDAVHAATAMRAGFDLIVTLDRDFGPIPGLAAMHPRDVPAVGA